MSLRFGVKSRQSFCGMISLYNYVIDPTWLVSWDNKIWTFRMSAARCLTFCQRVHILQKHHSLCILLIKYQGAAQSFDDEYNFRMFRVNYINQIKLVKLKGRLYAHKKSILN